MQNQRSTIESKKYKLREVEDIFDDSIEGMIALEENLLRSNLHSAKNKESQFKESGRGL